MHIIITGLDPFETARAFGATKLPAEFVQLELHRCEAGSDAEYDLVSIHAGFTEEIWTDPPTPYSLATSFYGLPGGTGNRPTADKLARSIIYWAIRKWRG